MPARVGVFSGAGLSAWAPASISTGDAFHRRLVALLLDRARTYAADVDEVTILDAIRVNHLHVLARLDNTRPGSGAGALHAMSVRIPSEAHLLAALHLARGGLHLTVNFDDGVERAYALLSGSAQLPTDAASRFSDALSAWRNLWPSSAPPLRTVSRPGRIGPALAVRPLLVKLHGSLGLHPDGVALPFPGLTDEPDVRDWGGERRRAVATLVEGGFVVVTGFSATDLPARSALLEGLQPGRFLWMSAEIDAEVRRLVSAIDPGQPLNGEPVEALCSALRIRTPPWPREPDGGSTFDERLQTWAAGVADYVAAEAVAWVLVDSGRPEEGAAILLRLLRDSPSARTTIRLADALSRRGRAGDAAVARRLLLRAALWPTADRPERGSRSYACARLAESLLVSPESPLTPGLRTVGSAAAVPFGSAVAALSSSSRHSTASVRAATVASGAVLTQLEMHLPALLRARVGRRSTAWVVEAARASARRVRDACAHAPSGSRGVMLERQTIELDAIHALLREVPPPLAALPRLARLSTSVRGVTDGDGRADLAGTRALVHLAAADRAAAEATLAGAEPLHRESRGVVRLARALLEEDALPGGRRRLGIPPSQRRLVPTDERDV